MTVAELISFLEEQEPTAQVLFAGQPSYPFEYSIRGVTTRGDVRKMESDEDPDDVLLEEDEDRYNEGIKFSDVILVEGSQLRYGDRAAWDAV